MNTFLYGRANALRWIDRFGLDCDTDLANEAERKRTEAAVREILARSQQDWVGVEDAIEDQKRYIRDYLRACGQAGEDSVPKAPLPEPRPPEQTPSGPANNPTIDPGAIPMPTLNE